MGSYLFRRLLNLIPILIGISFLSFVLINLSPSDPAEVAVRVNEVTPTEEVLAETRAKLGLDALCGLAEQLLAWGFRQSLCGRQTRTW